MASDIFGVSGRAMMAALVVRERDPKVLAQMARARMRAKISDLEEAYHGRFTDHHAFLLGTMLARIDALDTDIAAVETRIEDLIAPFAEAVARLDVILGGRRHRRPGGGGGEVGIGMTQFRASRNIRVDWECGWDGLLRPGQLWDEERHTDLDQIRVRPNLCSICIVDQLGAVGYPATISLLRNLEEGIVRLDSICDSRSDGHVIFFRELLVMPSEGFGWRARTCEP